MISQKHRFHGLGSLRFVYTKGQVVRSQHLGLKYVANARRSTWRAAVVVSKKVSKSAVVRNRIRRRVYEAVRLAVPTDQGVDLVFTAYSDAVLELSAAELQVVIHKLLSDAGAASIKAS